VVGDETDSRPRQIIGLPESLLPVAVLYGANASGKSNVLAALAFMRDAVVLVTPILPPDEEYRATAFAWGPKRNRASLFEVRSYLAVFVISTLLGDHECVWEEALCLANRKKQVCRAAE